MKTVKFTTMEAGDAQDYAYLDELEDRYKEGLVGRLMASLDKLEDSLSGYKVSRLEHVLQAATRAHRAGESDEWIAAALLHDIGDELAPYSHSEMAAAILRPFVGDEIYWVVKHHGIFQMFYYAHHSGGDRFARNRFEGHEYFDSAVKFCHEYDQNCFDPNYSSEPLSFFQPLLERVFATPKEFNAEHIARYGQN
jgi:predicted HD phosphohydrolase